MTISRSTHGGEATRLGDLLLLFLFEGVLLTDFLFDLLKSFQEELFNFTALIKHNLGKGSDVS